MVRTGAEQISGEGVGLGGGHVKFKVFLDVASWECRAGS